MKKTLTALLLAISMLLCTGCDLIRVVESTKATHTTTSPLPPSEIVTDGHTDKDNNGACDDCGISVIVLLDFYAVNDLHGKVCDTDSQPGVDELTTYLKNTSRTDDHTVFLSSGDMWQGSSESNLTRGFLVTEWMNELDFVSMTLGNHEFDWGEELISDNADIAEFPFLAINIFDAETNTPVPYCRPSVMVERGGLQIGVIGAIGNCHSSISGDHSDDVVFKVGAELTALVKAESKRLREAGADLIVYSIHDGYSKSLSGTSKLYGNQISGYYDVSLSDGYVDLVFEGHTHQRYVFTDPHGVYHLQNGGDNKGISHAEVAVNFANNQVVTTSAEFVSTSRYSSLADDPIVDTLLKKYQETVSLGNRVLGNNNAYRDRNALRQLLADLYYRFAEEQITDCPVVLGGGFFSVRSPGYLPVGQVTYSDLLSLFPFDNELVLCSIKGQDLDRNFFKSSNDNYFISYGDYGEQVREHLDPNATYYILTDSYTSTYAPNKLTELRRFGTELYARDLLAEYISEGQLNL